MVPLNPRLHSLLLTATGAALCVASAIAATVIFAHVPGRSFVPVAFIVVAAVLAAYFGSAAGIFGIALAALIFANWLYPPFGSIQVANAAARAELAWMLLGGVSLSYLLGGEIHGPHRK